MKKILSIIVILFILLPTFASVAEGSTTSEVKKTQAITELRVAASSKASIISSLPKGSLVIQLKTVQGGWSYVQVNDKKGYIATSTLIVPISTTKIVGSKNGLEIKETASTKSKALATPKYQMVVEDFGKVVSRWHLVRYGNALGYIDSQLLTASKPTKKYTNASVTLRITASTSGKKTGSLDKNKEVSVHSQISSWSYITSGSLKGYVPTSQLSATNPNATVQTLKTFTDLRPSKIKWMKYYFDGEVFQGNVKGNVYKNEYSYVVPSIYTSFSSKGFLMGLPESDWIWTNISTPLVQNKPTPILEFDWSTEKYLAIGNSYLRTTTGTITTPAGNFKNVVHIEDKFKGSSLTNHYYFAPGYGLVKVIDSKNRILYELRSFK